MRNEEADWIFSFWRWEYLRRNPGYIAAYNMMVHSLNHLVPDHLPYRVIGEDNKEQVVSFDIDKMLDEVTGRDEKETKEKRILCLKLLKVFYKEFDIQIPLNSSWGLSAEAILKKFIRADIDKRKGGTGDIDYRLMVRLNHSVHPFSAVRELEAVPDTKTEDEIRTRERFMGHYYPQLKKILSDIDFEEPEYEPRGKYFAQTDAPGALAVKDKQVLLAEDKFRESKSSLGYRGLKSAIRNRNSIGRP